MKQVRISDLKSHLSEHLRAAEAGEVIEVMDRARRIARLVPVQQDEDALEIVPRERPFATVRSVRVPPASGSMSSLDALREERGSH